MKRIAVMTVVAICLASSASAQQISLHLESDLELLGALREVREMWLDPRVADWEVNRLIDERIDRWRGPNPDGSYEWVIRERPDSEVVDSSEHLVYGTPDRLAHIEDSGSWVYGVKIVVPRKRSLFRGNHPVFVEEITVRTQDEDGALVEDRIGLERWFEPNTSQTWDFDTIVARADLAAEVAATPDHRGESLVEIHFLESVERDDPEGPYYDAIRAMQDVDSLLSAERIDRAIERVEQRLLPGVYSAPLALVADLLDHALAGYDSDDPEERKKARASLEEALRLLRQPR